MGILIVEFVTGGGEFLVSVDDGFSHELVAEGRTMRDTVAENLRAVTDEAIVVFHSPRQSPPALAGVDRCEIHGRDDFWNRLAEYGAEGPWKSELRGTDPGGPDQRSRTDSCDSSASAGWGILLIAPETDGWLTRLTENVERSSATLLSPDSQFVRLCADKTATVQWLASHGVPVPETHLDRSLGELAKPRFGCGSDGVQRVQRTANVPDQYPAGDWHLEPMGAGLPTSIACLRSSRGFALLPPFEQCFGSVDPWRYIGGRTLRDPALIHRCQNLARQTVLALPSTTGYFGIDLLLGDGEAADVVLEVNPRLTTSWVGLSQCLGTSLPTALLDVHSGRPPQLLSQAKHARFSLDERWHHETPLENEG